MATLGCLYKYCLETGNIFSYLDCVKQFFIENDITCGTQTKSGSTFLPNNEAPSRSFSEEPTEIPILVIHTVQALRQQCLSLKLREEEYCNLVLEFKETRSTSSATV